MATTFYLPSSGTTVITPAVDNTWTASASSFFRAPLVPTTKSGTALTSVTDTRTGSSGDQVCVAQYISAPMSSTHLWQNDTSAGFQVVIRCQESNNLSNSFLRCKIRILSNDGATERTIADNGTDETEFTTTLTSKHYDISTAPTFASYTNVVGDRLVVEIGYVKNSTTSYIQTLNFGDAAASDLTAGNSDTGADNPYVIADFTITFDPEITGSNQLMMMGCGT